jgi:hypothetical protein
VALLGALLVAIGAVATAICRRIPHVVERWRPRGVSALPILFVLGCVAHPRVRAPPC